MNLEKYSLDADDDELARNYSELKNILDDVRSLIDAHAKELANRALDQPNKIIVTHNGAFKARYVPPRKTYNRDDLARDLYRDAVIGKHSASPDGEIIGEPEQRVFAAFKECFRLEPKTTGLKKYEIDIDEYVENVSGEGSWTVQAL